MVSATTKIVNRMGLHARPASTFVVGAKKFMSDIRVAHEGTNESVNAKSIMMILASSFNYGDVVVITCDGSDEDEALNAMVALIESGLGDDTIE